MLAKKSLAVTMWIVTWFMNYNKGKAIYIINNFRNGFFSVEKDAGEFSWKLGASPLQTGSGGDCLTHEYLEKGPGTIRAVYPVEKEPYS